jgi:UTP:GlnB (protein PII) uridylyltransferase
MVVHARLADERSGPVCVGAFEQRGDLTGVCIVADDQPGLLATISEAMVHCQMDVVNAEVFTRRIGARTEAVDLFWLRKLDGGRPVVVTPEHVVELQRTLEELLDNTFEPREVNLPVADGVTASESRVRFIEDEEGALSTLEIETEDRSGLLYSLSRALFAQRVHVLRCEVRTESSRRVVDRFKIAESDGSAVGPGRRLEIQVAVLSAIEPAKRLSSAAPGCPDP